MVRVVLDDCHQSWFIYLRSSVCPSFTRRRSCLWIPTFTSDGCTRSNASSVVSIFGGIKLFPRYEWIWYSIRNAFRARLSEYECKLMNSHFGGIKTTRYPESFTPLAFGWSPPLHFPGKVDMRKSLPYSLSSAPPLICAPSLLLKLDCIFLKLDCMIDTDSLIGCFFVTGMIFYHWKITSNEVWCLISHKIISSKIIFLVGRKSFFFFIS